MATKRKTSTALNLSGLARKYGVSRETLRVWRDSGVNLADEIKVAEKIANMREKPTSDLAAARLEKIHAEIARIRHAHAVESREFVRASDIAAQGTQIGLAVRRAIERMANDLPAVLAGRDASEISVVLKKYGYDLLVGLSEMPSPITENLIEKP
jgi:transposase-like protein